MGAALFWAVVLASTLVQHTVVHCWSLFSNSPWEFHDYYSGQRSNTYDPYWSSWQTGGLQDMWSRGLHEDTGGASMGDRSSSHFGGDYGFPRYGGSARVSRYGIAYRSRHDRRRLSSGYGSLSYSDSGAYPRVTNEFHGREHPSSWYSYW
ncbi:uncharacterized protein LOC144100012 [Amblyomma americanum]